MFAAQALHERPPLLELSERGGVEPHVAPVAGAAAQDVPRVAVAAHEQAGLAAEERYDVGAEHVEVYRQ